MDRAPSHCLMFCSVGLVMSAIVSPTGCPEHRIHSRCARKRRLSSRSRVFKSLIRIVLLVPILLARGAPAFRRRRRDRPPEARRVFQSRPIVL